MSIKINYVPGIRCINEIKLNANENFFRITNNINFLLKIIRLNYEKIKFYPDSENLYLKIIVSKELKINIENIFICNGSDEGLAFIFFLFKKFFLKIPILNYPFYKVYCNYNNILTKNIFNKKIIKFTNIICSIPEAPSGIIIKKNKIIKNIKKKKLIIIDEAYSDFANFSFCKFINNNNNLIITKTFSKSYSGANIRIGFILSNKFIINKINFIKQCFNSYTINSISSYIAIECIKDNFFFFKSIQNNIFNKLLFYNSFNFLKIFSNSNFLLIKSNIDFIFFFKKKKFFFRKFYFNKIILLRITIPIFNIIKKIYSTFLKWS